MVKLIYIFIITIFSVCSLMAQNKPVDALFNKYSDSEGFKAVIMNDPASVLKQNETGESADVIRDLLRGIRTIKALTYKSTQGKVSDNGKNFSSELAKFNAGDGYSEIMSLNEGRSKVKSIVRKTGDKFTEFIMVIAGESESTLIWIEGDNINIQNVSNIGKILQLKGDKSGSKNRK